MAERGRPFTRAELRPFGTTIFAEMSGLAVEHGAVNLGQGFPDFDGPAEVIDAAIEAMRAGHNQYARSRGALPLVEAVARHQQHFYGIELDPGRQITVTAGATEGICAALTGLLEPGDEVVLFEPFYDSYPACAAMAGATPRYCTLRFPAEEGGPFTFDEDELSGLFNAKTRLLVLNTPHNPTGKVFTPEELAFIARLCVEHDVWVLADEVYEHLTYDGAEHVPVALTPGLEDRTLTLSSGGKTFSFTGWKIGWAMGPAAMIDAIQAAHQFTTYAVATPFQHAIARALHLAIDTDYLMGFRQAYTERRDFLKRALQNAGFRLPRTDGTYFALADFSALSSSSDRVFARELVETVKVAAIPPSVFYAKAPEQASHLLRFAFCKTLATLKEAGTRLERIAR